MSRLDDTLAQLRVRKQGAFMPFLVIGDPDLETSHQLSDALIRSGADVLEFGMAFSDPPADGPVIQAADVRALQAGVNTPIAFRFLAGVRARTDLPITLLVYYNLIHQYGLEPFYKTAAASGVNAVLVADLPIEEAGPAIEAAKAHGIAPVFIVSELTSSDRLERVLAVAEGYLYLVARVGITGEQSAVDSGMATTVARLRARTGLPILAGFGISSPEQVREVIEAGVDGAICGSAIVRRIEQHLGDPEAMIDAVSQFAIEMKAATCPPLE